MRISGCLGGRAKGVPTAAVLDVFICRVFADAQPRSAVVPCPSRGAQLGGEQAQRPSPPEPQSRPLPGAGRRPWAALMKWVLEIDVLLCSRRGGRRRVVAPYPAGQKLRDLLDRLALSQPPGLPPPQGFPDLDAAT